MTISNCALRRAPPRATAVGVNPLPDSDRTYSRADGRMRSSTKALSGDPRVLVTAARIHSANTGGVRTERLSVSYPSTGNGCKASSRYYAPVYRGAVSRVGLPRLLFIAPGLRQQVSRDVSDGFQNNISMHPHSSTWRAKLCSVPEKSFSA